MTDKDRYEAVANFGSCFCGPVEDEGRLLFYAGILMTEFATYPGNLEEVLCEFTNLGKERISDMLNRRRASGFTIGNSMFSKQIQDVHPASWKHEALLQQLEALHQQHKALQQQHKALQRLMSQ